MQQIKRTIIIAEDDKSFGELTEIILREALDTKYDYSRIDLGSNLDKILSSGAGNIALAVIDDDMKLGLKGSEIIKKYARKVKFPFILNYAPGDVEETIGKQALEDGAVAYFNKSPGTLKLLAEKAKEILEG